jgi:UDP-N-acetylglucosamine 2-epimerase (non-hydrolysing)
MTNKILIVFGTRPEIIKLAPLILALKDSSLKNKFIVASTSQHEILLDEQLDYWKITPDYFLTPSPFKGNLVRMLSHSLSGLQDIIEQVGSIEYIIVQGDTNTALACSALAFLNKIKLVHIESGLRTHDLLSPFPEEFNRTIASKVAYYHFAPTETSKLNLLKEGVDSSRIMVIGNTVIDALLQTKRNGTHPIKNSSTVIITLHRRENIEKNYLKLADMVCELSNQHPYLDFIWVTHPNCADEIRIAINGSLNIKIHDHMPYGQFIDLYSSAAMVITDSGGVSEEVIHLGLPVIIFREKTERTEAIRELYPMIVSLNKDEIIPFFNENIDKTNIRRYSYGSGNASLKIIDWLENESDLLDYDTLIVGGGPAGTGLLLKALKDGKENKLLNTRIALIEKSSHLIKGNITQYKVNSDTASEVFLECLEGAVGSSMNLENLKNEINLIHSYQGNSIPLELLNEYYNKLGLLLKAELEANKKCDFFMESCVSKISKKTNGTYEVYLENNDQAITTKHVIIATGGTPQNIIDKNLAFADIIPLNKFRNKCAHSDQILKSGIREDLQADLRINHKVVILGGSHSAFSVAHFLLNLPDSFQFASGDIKIWSKTMPKVYFNSKEDALASGYTDFTDFDLCPITKKLYRLAGLRMDGRNLYMQILGLGNVEKEKRVHFNLFTDQIDEIENDLHDASIIVLAYGYKLNIPLFLNAAGEQVKFEGETTNHWVNQNCELLDENGNTLPNVFATGLATGFIPSGELGGEPSFEGQTNGIWYYQNAIADRIINQL